MNSPCLEQRLEQSRANFRAAGFLLRSFAAACHYIKKGISAQLLPDFIFTKECNVVYNNAHSA
jgi:hypothetical protein